MFKSFKTGERFFSNWLNLISLQDSENKGPETKSECHISSQKKIQKEVLYDA